MRSRKRTGQKYLGLAVHVRTTSVSESIANAFGQISNVRRSVRARAAKIVSLVISVIVSMIQLNQKRVQKCKKGTGIGSDLNINLRNNGR